MKTSLEHLPESKQAQLRAIAELFRDCTAVDKLILFGSFARGNWVEDRETGYVSDYDLCVVVDTEKQVADLSLWGELERRTREIAGRTPVTLIVHDIKFINHEIRRGQFFFADGVTRRSRYDPGSESLHVERVRDTKWEGRILA